MTAEEVDGQGLVSCRSSV